MLILVAHSGKTLELDVHSSTRVDAVQNALATLCSLPPPECIIICKGVRLDPSRTLAAYNLPTEMTQSGGELLPRPDVFLYSRSWLRPDGPAPRPEALPCIRADEPSAPDGPMCRHPLDEPELCSPLRALPGHERRFKHHVATAQVVWGATHERLRVCKRLLSEQEVQSMAIDAARANVELHYKYIHKAFNQFMSKYTGLQQAQREVLINFESDMTALAATELHPGAVSDGQRYLVDLVPAERLKEWAEHCRLSREQFAAKVSELEGIFSGLQGKVEGLLLKAPRTDLDEMGRHMERMDARLFEEAEISQRLQGDYSNVQRKVEDVVRQLALAPATSLTPDAYCLDLEAISASHEKQEIPRMRACDLEVDEFLRRCTDTKNEMTLEVREQLVQISEQQSRIRDMRNKLAVFQEVASKQGELFAELCLVGRIPAAYRACLAEVVRRRAFQELYAGQAAQLAERMAGLREREAARQEIFRNHVDPYITPELQGRLGLLLPPPLCEVNIPSNPDGSLPEVTMEDIQAAPREVRPSQLVVSVFKEWIPAGPQKHVQDPALKEAPKGAPAGGGGGGTSAGPQEPTFEELQLQNAQLRADLAAFRAAAHLKQMKAEDPVAAAWSSASASESQLQLHPTDAPQQPPLRPSGGSSSGSAAAKESTGKREADLFADALAAKDALVQQLQAQIESRDTRLETCLERIASLEAAQSSMILPSGGSEGTRAETQGVQNQGEEGEEAAAAAADEEAEGLQPDDAVEEKGEEARHQADEDEVMASEEPEAPGTDDVAEEKGEEERHLGDQDEVMSAGEAEEPQTGGAGEEKEEPVQEDAVMPAAESVAPQVAVEKDEEEAKASEESPEPQTDVEDKEEEVKEETMEAEEAHEELQSDGATMEEADGRTEALTAVDDQADEDLQDAEEENGTGGIDERDASARLDQEGLRQDDNEPAEEEEKEIRMAELEPEEDELLVSRASAGGIASEEEEEDRRQSVAPPATPEVGDLAPSVEMAADITTETDETETELEEAAPAAKMELLEPEEDQELQPSGTASEKETTEEEAPTGAPAAAEDSEEGQKEEEEEAPGKGEDGVCSPGRVASWKPESMVFGSPVACEEVAEAAAGGCPADEEEGDEETESVTEFFDAAEEDDCGNTEDSHPLA